MDCIDCGGPDAAAETMRCEPCRVAGLKAITIVAVCFDSGVAVTPPLSDDTDFARLVARLAAWLAEALELNEQNGGVAAQEVLRRMSSSYEPTNGESL